MTPNFKTRNADFGEKLSAMVFALPSNRKALPDDGKIFTHCILLQQNYPTM